MHRGGTLRKLHPKGARLPLETVISYVKQVASALQYAHVQRLIHRDLKPENLLLGPEQQIWLADFGLAVVVHSARSQPFQQTAGTLAYMAPEQLKDQPVPASDQYALGVMVYEWLCGEQPFSGSFPELAVQHTLAPPPSLTKKVPTLPAGVEHVVLTALAKDPEQRFAGAHAFALALEEACRTDAFARQTLPLLSSVSPAQDRHASKHNLPAPLTPLLGREQEVAAVCTLLRRPEVRLVTLTGTGGIGKTRLAVHVATEVLADFPDGVSFVSLAPISDPALLLSAIAQVLDVKESRARPLLDLLAAFLREKHLLLCLDNFEQLLPEALHLMDLLTRCPHLTILLLCSLNTVTKESAKTASCFRWTSPDPGFGSMIELSGRDASGLLNLVRRGLALPSEGIAAEKAPPPLLQIAPARSCRNEDVMKARMRF